MALRRRPFIRPPARTSLWLTHEPAQDAVAASANTLIAVLGATALALRPFTVVRTRLMVKLCSDQVAASENPFGAFGIIVTTEQATAAGAASIPNPSTDGDADWFVHQPLFAPFTFLSSAGVFDNDRLHVIDSKAMRKVGNNQDLAFMYDMNTGVGGTFFSGGRILVKLS